MKKLNSRGFSAIEGLLILGIVGIIGGISYFVYRSNQDTQKSYDSSLEASKTVNEQVNIDKGPGPSPIDPNLKSTLEIKEWGVKIDIIGATDPIYKMVDNTAFISSKKHQESEGCKDPNYGSSEEFPYFQGITRYSDGNAKPMHAYPSEKETLAELAENPRNGIVEVKKIGDYYYSYLHGNGSDCAPTPVDYHKAFLSLSDI